MEIYLTKNSTQIAHKIHRKVSGKQQPTINKLSNCILWGLCLLVCFHNIFILTMDKRPAVLQGYYHQRSHPNLNLEEITQKEGDPKSTFHASNTGSRRRSEQQLQFSLPAEWMVMSGGISVNSKLWVICIYNSVVTSSSACLSLGTDIPWILVYLSQDQFPQYCSLQIWTFISPKQGRAYIFYVWDLEKKPSKCESIRTDFFFFQINKMYEIVSFSFTPEKPSSSPEDNLFTSTIFLQPFLNFFIVFQNTSKSRRF